ncbi:MAG TPA: hypothetical protein VN922_05840, partial [Bacteroidia bacterium]|nr:hypothetical protein [Bacteroidia bacterium]
APVGLLQPIPIPTQPFEIVTMDFIPELPESNGYDNILVIVDKLTKYGIFIPTTTKIDQIETAKLFVHYVICQYGIPRQVITDRDPKWKGDFWKEVSRLMGFERSLSTSAHPQTDGQTEILNQGLEITLRAFVGPTRDDWSQYLDVLALSYNTNPHTATGFSPAYLLRGYHPLTQTKILTNPPAVTRPTEVQVQTGGDTPRESLHKAAEDMADQFEAERAMAKEALLLGQIFQKKAYNKGRLIYEFKIGDLVVINPHSLNLLKSVKGKGEKLLMKYEGPFEIIQKLSPTAYRLRMPASFGMHPVINIAHLERYNKSPEELGERPIRSIGREDFIDLPEYEVERIIDEKLKKRGSRRIRMFKTRFAGYGPEFDEWLTAGQLKNAPDVLKDWEARSQAPRPNLR